MDPRLKNVKITKYCLIILMIINILSSIWVIIYDLKTVRQVEYDFPDDPATGEKHQGHYARYWFVACCLVTVVNIIISLVTIYAAYEERSLLIMSMSALLAIIAVYGGWDKYMRGSVVAFFLPLLGNILGTLFGTLILWAKYHAIPQTSFPFDHSQIVVTKNHSKPTTPTVKTFEEADNQSPYQMTVNSDGNQI